MAALDLVPFARVHGSGGRAIHDRSAALWAVLALIGGGPLLVLAVGW